MVPSIAPSLAMSNFFVSFVSIVSGVLIGTAYSASAVSTKELISAMSV